jgi:hypothetical protein
MELKLNTKITEAVHTLTVEIKSHIDELIDLRES